MRPSPTRGSRAASSSTRRRAEIDQQIHQAREALRGEVVTLAVSGAEQVLMREVDAAAHEEALGKLAAQL